ncbi:hypothetical protein SIL08_16200 [Scandinavium sp. V105_16]|uniref:Uncharacterized protein n=1 Tax=Scandinavium lactucae TaxID=3095028 RepID=A0AAJ2S9W1_9ENTR|nr:MULTISPECIES: hypothetical protein [unclassified Scandinavium]MDX6021818.1 hypothetical protein [Scandinavium sp. V105_16]MDX6032436.1 hypothetical protein [Scandinavium sp. V105_12]MDX6040989.1 hypothetical protein [Scandinavium sp. V105_6]MDX6050841.1 hypothetical protein [Scandinavium sp. V105_1]
MEATAVWTHPLLFVNVEPETDFTEVAEHCENLAASALEAEHMQTQHELYQRLHECLTQLQPTLLDPIPDNLIAQFTVNEMPSTEPVMDTETELLCEYCLALSHLLSGNPLSLSVEETLQGLLYELTCFMTDTMLAPRWLNTPQGLQPIA